MYLDLLNAERRRKNAEDVNFIRLQEGFQLLLLSVGEEAISTVPPSTPQTSSSWKLSGFVYVAVENVHSLVAQVTLRAVNVVDLIEEKTAVDNHVDAKAVRHVLEGQELVSLPRLIGEMNDEVAGQVLCSSLAL